MWWSTRMNDLRGDVADECGAGSPGSDGASPSQSFALPAPGLRLTRNSVPSDQASSEQLANACPYSRINLDVKRNAD